MFQPSSIKPFVFVIMPFAAEFNDIYKLGIKAACQDAGTYCERIDEIIFTESILEKIYNQILKADLIIADMTDRNPNVFYEVGYAHALGKQVIHLTQNSDDIPFDMKHFPHIVYGKSISLLKDELGKRVEWFVKNPQSSIKELDFLPDFYINGAKLVDDDVYKIRTPTVLSLNNTYKGYRIINLRVDIHNSSKYSADLSKLWFGLALGNYDMDRQVSEELNVEKDIPEPEVVLPTGENLYIISLETKLFPDSWTSVIFERILVNLPQKCSFRVFSEIGTTVFNLTLANQNPPPNLAEMP